MRGADKFPGGRVVTGCFIVLAVSSGLGFYGLAVYLNAFSDERGWPVASISLATTLYFIVGGVAGLYVARLIARRDVRIPIVGGAIVGGVSLALLGQVDRALAAVRRVRRVRPRVRRRRADPGDDRHHPLVPHPALGRPVASRRPGSRPAASC